MYAVTARLRLTVAFVLVLLIVVPNAGAASYPPSFALHPAFSSASIGTDGSILVNLEEEYERSNARHSTTSRYLADGQLDRSFKPDSVMQGDDVGIQLPLKRAAAQPTPEDTAPDTGDEPPEK